MKSFVQKSILLVAFFVAFVATPVAHADTTLPPGIIERNHCGSTTVDVRGFGAGLMYQVAPIVPQNDHVVDVRPTEGCAVIEWTTPIVATAQVIIAEVGAQPQSVDATHPPYYWYPAGTTQNADAVGLHRVVVKDLIPGKTYSYRIVSRSHPTAVPYISEEKFLTVPLTTVPVVTSVPPVVPVIVPTVPSTSVVPTVAVTVTTTQPKVTYTTTIVTDTHTVVVPTTVSTTGTSVQTPVMTMTDTTHPAESADMQPISALAAATDAATGTVAGNTFWKRFVRAFSFGHIPDTNAATDTAAVVTANETPSALIVHDNGVSKKAPSGVKDVKMSDRYIVPSLFFLVLLYLLQQLLLPAFGMKVERPLVFWMFGVIAIAVFAGLLKLFYVTVFMLAVFLALLAWYILDLFDEEKPSTPKTV